MPESRSRRRQRYTAPRGSTAARPRATSRLIAPAMVTCWVLGLLWIVAYYILGDRVAFIGNLGFWNIVIGMALVGVGFVFATRWE